MQRQQPPKKLKPWQRRRPRPVRPDTIVTEATPIMEIRIYHKSIIVTRRDERGEWTSYPVTPEALAQTLASVPVTSGLLPTNTLATGRIDGQPFYVIATLPRVATLATPHAEYRIPIPALVFAGRGQDYRVWALPDVPAVSTKTPLFVAPFPNSYRDGSICWGNVSSLPHADTKIRQVLTTFLEESFFNGHVADHKSKKYPVSVIALWQELHDTKAEAYPTEDMMPTEHTIGWLIEGGPWNR